MDNQIGRRTILKTSAWAVPAVTVAAAAPAFASSTTPRKDPGINGWVQVSYGKPFLGTSYAKFDSDPDGTDPSTPDGNPFGLYVYDVNVGPGGIEDDLAGASIILWFRGKVSSWSKGDSKSNSNSGGHGSDWSHPSYIGKVGQPDGRDYYGYQMNYSGPFTAHGDGRVYLQDIEIEAKGIDHSNLTFWVERHILVNGEMQAFKRRNGQDGPQGEGFPAGRMSARSSDGSSGVVIA